MDDLITLSIFDIVLIILLSVIVCFIVFRTRYWVGYRDGFFEGLDSGSKKSLEAIEEFKKSGDLQKIINENLDRNPGFVELMKNVGEIYKQSLLLWQKHGKDGDALDKALTEFRENRLSKEGPADETQTAVV